MEQALERIVLVGKPNSGKSLLFNQLTGLRQKVANFPGVTVELKSGKFDSYELVDFPGTYSLEAISEDESIAIEQLHHAMQEINTKLILCNLDGTKLERSLVFALQVQTLAKKHNKSLVFTINMMDDLLRFGHDIDTEKMSAQLGSPIYAISAKSLYGMSEFTEALKTHMTHPDTAKIAASEEENQIQQDHMSLAKSIAAEHGIKPDIVLKKQNHLDSFLLNNILGGFSFLLIMLFLFQSIFTWAAPLMDAVESAVGWSGSMVVAYLPEGAFADFVNDAIFGGVGAFLVFVPQIMVLTLIIGILEDSGYLARAALICHKPLSLFGLSGRSFIPYLSGDACAIPAIMAARTIESPRKRLITMMTVPLMSCSARLPVYALLIAVFVPDTQYLGGWVNLQGLVFFLLYFGGIFTALVMSKVLNRMVDKRKQSDLPFILELPSYRWVNWKPLLYRTLNSAYQFIRGAAPIIFTVSLVIWVLGYFPSQGDLNSSYLAHLGQFIEPLFAPLGLDWRYALAILISFLAREVFVGVLGTLFSMDNADENIDGLAAQLQADGLTAASGIALMAFYVIALQCVATVASLKAETGKKRYSWGVYIAYGTLAYVVSVACYMLLS
ncbi:ferrous iron transporter B [Glaciecola petra]|uniref:Ferrous iron transport protein B n=1 Tax=Glaciecola petra TaxID=3075602 RepID=A0ABU2ZTI3_9ALTE|nr:ferrous iron transporter B [Aestuariibacter sp. P117]MDT0595716.1 ferrous iron transporter B [Aestuariibacter sp. P117]